MLGSTSKGLPSYSTAYRGKNQKPFENLYSSGHYNFVDVNCCNVVNELLSMF